MWDRKTGKLFGINIIDLLALIILFLFLPAMFVGYKVISRAKPPKQEIKIPEFYLINGTCRNCGANIKVKIKYEHQPPKFYPDTCKLCGIESYLIKPQKIPRKEKGLTLEDQYYQLMIEKNF